MDCINSKTNTTDCCNMVLAIAYVAEQEWEDIYDPCKALARGTIFVALDKPFKGGCR